MFIDKDPTLSFIYVRFPEYTERRVYEKISGICPRCGDIESYKSPKSGYSSRMKDVQYLKCPVCGYTGRALKFGLENDNEISPIKVYRIPHKKDTECPHCHNVGNISACGYTKNFSVKKKKIIMKRTYKCYSCGYKAIAHKFGLEDEVKEINRL